MYGGAQVGRREIVPEWEAQELLRLALIVRADCAIEPASPDARRVLGDLFHALALVERVGRRLRDQALTRLLADVEGQTGPVRDLCDLAELATVPLEHVQQLAARRESAAPVEDPVVEDPGG